MNELMVIHPYKYHDLWVFDDKDKELEKEPFVMGIDKMLDKIAPGSAFTVIFSAKPFPGHEHHLTWLRAEHGGNWYRHEQLDMEGWLCAALYKYFGRAPSDLFIQVKQ